MKATHKWAWAKHSFVYMSMTIQPLMINQRSWAPTFTCWKKFEHVSHWQFNVWMDLGGLLMLYCPPFQTKTMQVLRLKILVICKIPSVCWVVPSQNVQNCWLCHWLIILSNPPLCSLPSWISWVVLWYWDYMSFLNVGFRIAIGSFKKKKKIAITLSLLSSNMNHSCLIKKVHPIQERNRKRQRMNSIQLGTS